MKTIRIFLAILIIAFAILIFIFALYPKAAPNWTGFYFTIPSELGFYFKTLWDWLELLLIPLFLALGAWVFSYFEKQTSQNNELNNERQKVLSTFLEQISTIIINHDIYRSNNKQDVISVIRSIITSTMRQLDNDRKAEALQIIYELNLISITPIIDLIGVNFDGINLANAPLAEAEIKGAYFRNSNFRNANLNKSIFIGCNFSNSDFRGANLDYVDFSSANLYGADLSGCDLHLTKFENTKMENTKMMNAILPK